MKNLIEIQTALRSLLSQVDMMIERENPTTPDADLHLAVKVTRQKLEDNNHPYSYDIPCIKAIKEMRPCMGLAEAKDWYFAHYPRK